MVFGKIEIRIYGILIPKPIKKKIKKSNVDVWVKAIVVAVPTKGAVQGVASKVAKKPLKKFLLKKLSPEFKILELFIKIGNLISNNPKVFKKKNVKTSNIKIKKYGS